MALVHDRGFRDCTSLFRDGVNMSETVPDPANNGPQRPNAASRSEAGGSGPEPASLPHLLVETTAALGAVNTAAPWQAALTKEDRARLANVVLRRGTAAVLDLATAADLVEAVLPEALASLASDSVSRRRLMERIAQSLLDDPQCTARMRTLLTALRSTAGDAGGKPASGGAQP